MHPSGEYEDNVETNDLQTTLVRVNLSNERRGSVSMVAKGIRNAIGLWFDPQHPDHLLFTSFGSDRAAGIPDATAANNVPDCTVEVSKLGEATANDDSPSDGWWADFVAGWASGAVSVLACQPMDTILTRLQAGQQQRATATGSTGEAVGTIASSVRSLIGEFGVASLWRGSYPMIGVVPFQNALLMGGYGIGKQYYSLSSSSSLLLSDNKNNNNSHHEGRVLLPVFVGGCAGGVLQSFLVSPVEWIKVHQQTGTTEIASKAISSTTTPTALGTRNLARTLHKSGLWNRGLTATLLRDGIPHGVWFASYEYCKVEMLRATKSSSSNNSGSNSNSHNERLDGYYEGVTVPLVSGAFAATIAWVSFVEWGGIVSN